MEERRRPSAGCTIVLAVLFGLLAGIGAKYLPIGPRPSATAPVSSTVGTGGGELPPTQTVKVEVVQEDSAITQAVKRAAPASVKVLNEQTVRYMPLPFPFGQPQERKVQGHGSGVVVDFEGRKYVLTNAHVVADAQRVYIKLPDGRTLDASSAVSDAERDVAIVSPADPAADLPLASLGDSNVLQLGQTVIAIGNPFFFDHTVTVGHVSALGYRQMGPGPEDWRNLIQTDAAINEGNSGGPLVDLKGNIIGINSAIFSPVSGVGVNVGIGFAIPINDARELIYFLVHRGPWLGIRVRRPNIAGLEQPGPEGQPQPTTPPGVAGKGLIIAGADPGSPADQAGIQPRDVLTAIDGQETNTVDDMRSAILAHRIGDRIAMTIEREGRPLRVDVVAGKLPEGTGR